MKQIVYISKQTQDFDLEAINALTELSNRNNKQVGVTGSMLYASGYFLQLLEGDEIAVSTLYEKIRKDPRHHSCVVLLERQIGPTERMFGSWFMSSCHIGEMKQFPQALKERINNLIASGRNDAMDVFRIFSDFRAFLA